MYHCAAEHHRHPNNILPLDLTMKTFLLAGRYSPWNHVMIGWGEWYWVVYIWNAFTRLGSNI